MRKFSNKKNKYDLICVYQSWEGGQQTKAVERKRRATKCLCTILGVHGSCI